MRATPWRSSVERPENRRRGQRPWRGDERGRPDRTAGAGRGRRGIRFAGRRDRAEQISESRSRWPPHVESLNVAVATALLVYEARRQRALNAMDSPGLFDDADPAARQRAAADAPLADRMRPRTLDEVVGPGRAARAGRAAAGGYRTRRPAIADLLGSARHRQDHARAPDRRPDEGAIRVVQRRPVGHQGDQGGDGARGGHPPAERPAHDPLRRRDSPVQQGAAGRVPSSTSSPARSS